MSHFQIIWAVKQEARDMIEHHYVYRQTKPLYELVTSRDFVQADSLKRNLKRALSEYLAETSACRCAPCHNNGVAVLKGIRLWIVS